MRGVQLHSEANAIWFRSSTVTDDEPVMVLVGALERGRDQVDDCVERIQQLTAWCAMSVCLSMCDERGRTGAIRVDTILR